jgi:7,8-dihydroneopterin aldolase/epimerase/oxygenase
MTRAEIRTFPAVAPLGEGAPALDLVFIEGFEGQTIIGIHQGEFDTPQPLRIDIVAGTPPTAASHTDEIADTIDYSRVLLALRDLMENHGVRLLEALAERIARLLLDDFGAHWVRVRVVKPRKFPDADAVGVTIERRRTPAPAGGQHANVLSLLGRGLIPHSH